MREGKGEHYKAIERGVITRYFIILVNVPKVSSGFLGGVVLGKLAQLGEALGSLREGRTLSGHCAQPGTAHNRILPLPTTYPGTHQLVENARQELSKGWRGRNHITANNESSCRTGPVNIRFSSQFPLIAKVFADREAWTVGGGRQSYVVPSDQESVNKLTLWVSEVQHMAVILDHVDLKRIVNIGIRLSC